MTMQLMASVVYRCSKVINPLRKSNLGYKLKLRETSNIREKQPSIEILKSNKKPNDNVKQFKQLNLKK